MKVSGFSMVKNATKLYYPVKESIESVLPLCDEFIIALGDCDPDDRTLEEIKSINSDKIKIINTTWDIAKYRNGTELAHQTDIAEAECSGDWLIYIQADELMHENDYDTIKSAMEKYKDDDKVDGLIFKYKHFWGDYNHYQKSHGWYKNELRIIKNDTDIHSWRDAQSFRRIPNFDGKSYSKEEDTFKLNVKQLDAHIYHYGWVRPPQLMTNKKKSFENIYKNRKKDSNYAEYQKQEFDYGPMNKIAKYDGTHPKLMQRWIDNFDWADKLYSGNGLRSDRDLFKHEKNIYKIVSLMEKYLNGGDELFGFNNWNRV